MQGNSAGMVVWATVYTIIDVSTHAYHRVVPRQTCSTKGGKPRYKYWSGRPHGQFVIERAERSIAMLCLIYI